MIELALNGIVKYYGATKILENITFEVQSLERVGIVGDNGCGKTTVMKIISGQEGYDGGSLFIKRGSVVGYLSQIPEFPEAFTVDRVLNTAFSSLQVIEIQMKELEEKLNTGEEHRVQQLLDKYSQLQSEYEALGGYDKEQKLSRVCTGLGFKEVFLARSFESLSGGEKTRVVLGKLLLENPDILLLDEPTNHLDIDTVEWLEDYLKSYKGMVVIVSHDRYFLDRVTNKIVEIEDKVSTFYKGNYTDYVNEKERNMLLQFEAYKEEQKKIKAVEKAIKDLRDWGARSDNNKFFRRAASMQKALDKINRIEKPCFEKRSIRADINKAGRSGNEVIKAVNLSKGFGDKKIFKSAELLIRQGERAALLGANGSGKSTFVKLLLDLEAADNGEALLGASISLAYLPQHISFPNEELTVLEAFREDINLLEGKAREYLSKYLFYGEMVYRKVKNLSGGEKSRLKLAKLLYYEVNLLILDEPTNHLDIASIESLEETLLGFKGTILFISHDRYFINKLSTRIIAIEHQNFKSYEGDYEYYRQKKNELLADETIRNTEVVPEAIKDGREKKDEKNKERLLRQEQEKEIKKLERQKGILEQCIASLEQELKAVQDKMSEVASDYQLLSSLEEEGKELQKKLDQSLENWISCDGALEELKNNYAGTKS